MLSLLLHKNNTNLFATLWKQKGCAETTLEERRMFAKEAFAVSSHYDSAIFNYFDKDTNTDFRATYDGSMHLRYGENPHQKGYILRRFL